MSELYPLKFVPHFKDKIWGGNKIKTVLNKDFSPLPNCGETWELSGVQGNLSVVKEGALKDNNIQELVEVYMGDLVGDKIYKKYGIEFPLLIKFIDANADLSIQVHPDDKLSKERHNAYGKTEMWYVLQADEGSQLISGFNQEVTKETYLKKLEEKKLPDILNYETVKAGDVFFIPAGRVHAIGSGLLIAEIQQTSDVTYRIYDFDRRDAKGNTRELHTDWALDAIDYTFHKKYKTDYNVRTNKSNPVVRCDYFTTNIIQIDKQITPEYNELDSFVIYCCTDGCFEIEYAENKKVQVTKGETVLLPAVFEYVDLIPKPKATILEVYIK